jgi:hypothetical protein
MVGTSGMLGERCLLVTPMGGSPETAAKFFASEIVKWNRVIKAAGIRAD